MAFDRIKTEMISNLTEKEFREELIVPLLRRMGMKRVDLTHGANEFGKDVVCYTIDPLGEKTVYAVVAKTGKVHANAQKDDSLETTLRQVRAIIDQATTAIKVEYDDLETRSTVKIDKVIVWTTGSVSQQARRSILSEDPRLKSAVLIYDGGKTIELLDAHYPEFWSIGKERIADFVKSTTEFHARATDLLVLGSTNHSLSLENIFVEPILTAHRTVLSRSKRFARWSLDKLIKSQRKILLIGSAGMGKSTSLRMIALRLLRRYGMRKSNSLLPLFLELRRIDFSLDDPLKSALFREFVNHAPSTKWQEIEIDLVEGNVIVLLDGLDELRDEAIIKLALQQIESFSTRYPSTRIVLSSRDMELFENRELFAMYDLVEMRAFSPDQIETFIEKWFGKGNLVGRQLTKIIADTGMFFGLPTTPLTLALIAVIHQSGEEVPANLTEIYNKYMELALGRWDQQAKSLKLQIEWKKKQFVLRRLAWFMQSQALNSLSSTEFSDIISEVTTTAGFEFDTSPLLGELCERAEILYETDLEGISFRHRSFREYFAALEIDSSPDTEAFISQVISDPRWALSVFFACGMRPERGSYLETVLRLEDIGTDELDPYVYAMNLGTITQAMYLAPVEVKARAIRRTLIELAGCWNSFAQFLTDISEEYNIPTPTQGIMIAIFGLLGKASLGSATLKVPLRRVASEIVQEDQPGEIQAVSFDLQRFLLACSCFEAGEFDAFADLTRTIANPQYQNYLLFLIGNETAEKSRLLSPEEVAILKEAEKRIGRRVRSMDETLRDALDRSPAMFPDSHDLQGR